MIDTGRILKIIILFLTTKNTKFPKRYGGTMKFKLSLCFGLLLLPLLSSCTTTRLGTTWKTKDVQETPFQKILIIAEAKKAPNRLMFEDEFVKEMESRGMEALASYKLLPSVEGLTREKVKEAIKGKGMDSVLLMRVTEIDEELRERPATVYYEPYHYEDFYSRPHAWNTVSVSVEPGYTYSTVYVRAESVLFSTQTGKPVWTVLTETKNPENPGKALKSFKKTILKDLDASGLLPSRK